MKLLNKQIDMISWTSKEGVVTPVRFRMEEDGKSIVIRIGQDLTDRKKYVRRALPPFLFAVPARFADRSAFMKSLITVAVRNGF